MVKRNWTKESALAHLKKSNIGLKACSAMDYLINNHSMTLEQLDFKSKKKERQ